MATINKTLRFFRVVDHEGQPFNLEAAFRLAREALPTVTSSEIRTYDEVLRVQHCRPEELFIHIVRYMPGTPNETLASGVEAEEDDEVAYDPPVGMEYKDGDFYIYSHGHNVVACAHGMSMTSGKITSYLKEFIRRGTVTDENPDGSEYDFKLSCALNLATLDLIRRHGVRSLGFKASAYQASNPEIQANTPFQALRRRFGRFAEDHLAQLDDEHRLDVLEDLVVEGVVRLNGNTRAHETAQRIMQEVAEENYEDESITIYTQQNEPIHGSDMKLQTIVRMDKIGKGLDYDQVWRRLRIYYNNLEAQQLLEQ